MAIFSRTISQRTGRPGAARNIAGRFASDRRRLSPSKGNLFARRNFAASRTVAPAILRCLLLILIAAQTILPGSSLAANRPSAMEADWQRIQQRDPGLSILDHWSVCGIKYRTRVYKDLFTCLDRVEERVVREANDVRSGKKALATSAYTDYGRLPDNLDNSIEMLERYVGFYTSWMRTEAFVELGQLHEARDAANAALNILSPSPDASALRWCCIKFGGNAPFGSESPELACRNNPAGIDFDYMIVRMRLLAQLGLVNALLGEAREAEKSAAELENLFELTGLRPYGTMARLQASIPLFALGKHEEVVRIHEEVQGTDEYKELTERQSVKSHSPQSQNSPALTRSQNLLFNLVMQLAVTVVAHLTDAQDFDVGLDGASALYLYATSLARLGKVDEAKDIFDQMLADNEIQNMGSIFWNVAYERGQISLKKGKRSEGLDFLRRSVDAIENVRSSISFEASKIGFAGSKQAVYGALVGALAEAGEWREAFQIVERAKARALVDLLAEKGNLAPPVDSDEKTVQLLAQAAVPDVMLPAAVPTAQRRGPALAAREQLGKMAPEAASLISVQSVQLSAISGRLAPSETLVNYFQNGQDLYALVLNEDAVRGFRLSGLGLETEVRRFRAELQSANPKALQTAKVLYDRLVRPIAGEFKGSTLTITPHGVLHYVPFAALSDGKKHLIDSYGLRVMPSASALAYLRTDKPVKRGKLLALGNPDLGDAKLDLPSAQREAMQVASLYPSSKALVRQHATKTALKEVGNGFEILHIASHGQFDSDAPLKSGLLLAKGGETNGLLTVEDLYGMRFDVDLVTLSGCETGLGKVATGDDVVGLTRGFLYAGARTIVSSLWQVDDEATARLMTSFYRNLERHGKREALRLAQMETRKTYAHPFYWAAFGVTGNG